MVYVLKRNKKKQAFGASKIRRSVEMAAKEAKLAPGKIKELVKEVAEPVISLVKRKRVVKTTNLRRSLLGRLDRRAKSVSRAWRRHEKTKGKCECC